MIRECGVELTVVAGIDGKNLLSCGSRGGFHLSHIGLGSRVLWVGAVRGYNATAAEYLRIQRRVILRLPELHLPEPLYLYGVPQYLRGSVRYKLSLWLACCWTLSELLAQSGRAIRPTTSCVSG